MKDFDISDAKNWSAKELKENFAFLRQWDDQDSLRALADELGEELTQAWLDKMDAKAGVGKEEKVEHTTTDNPEEVEVVKRGKK